MTFKQQGWLNELSRMAIDDARRFMPNLDSDPSEAVNYYVVKPSKDCELVDLVFAGSAGSLYFQFQGGLLPEHIMGVFPLNEPDEALCLAESLLEDQQDENESENETENNEQ